MIQHQTGQSRKLKIPVKSTKIFDMQKHSKLVITVIILAAILLRLWGAFSDLPYIFHPDEPRYISIIQGILKTSDLNPHFFNYPSMFLYINALAHVPYFLLGKLLGIFNTPADILAPISLAMGTTLAPTISSVNLSRLVTIVFAVTAIFLIFLVGKKLTGHVEIGLLAALMMTVSPTVVSSSRFITPDMFVVFWGLVTLLASTLVFQQGKKWQYILAGLVIGFTASSKYNGALIMVCVVTAHFLRYGWAGIRNSKLYLAACFSIVGFILVTPYAILDYQHFLTDLRFEAQHYATGHAGAEGNAFLWYVSYVWKIEGIMSLLALIQLIRGLYFRSKESILISTFTVAYFGFISTYVVRNDRTLLLAIPFMILLSSIFLFDMFNLRLFSSRLLQIHQKSLVFTLSLVVLFVPLWNTAQASIQLTTVNSRTTARLWIDSNLPEGSRVAIESYSPFINPVRYLVQGELRMIDNVPKWYIDNDFDYLVFSQGMFGRYFSEPDKYAHEISLYNSLFESFTLVKTFHDGGYEIRVYQVQK